MKFEIGSKAKFNVVNLVENDKKIEDSNLLSLLVKEGVYSNKKQEVYVDYNVDKESTLYVGLGNLDKLKGTFFINIIVNIDFLFFVHLRTQSLFLQLWPEDQGQHFLQYKQFLQLEKP